MARAKKPTEVLRNPKAELVDEPQRGTGAPTKYDPKFCDRLIEHNRQGLPFNSFGATVRASIRTLYDWCDAHPEFLHAKEVGEQLIIDFYAQVGRNIAMGVVPKGPEGAMMTRGSAAMCMYLMRVHGRKLGYDLEDDMQPPGAGDGSVTFTYLTAPAKKVDGA